MKYGPDYRFWCVVNARPESEMCDVLYQASLRELELQFKGGLTMEDNPTLFTDQREAEIEAFGRITCQKAASSIMKNMAEGIDRIEILDGDGKVLFEADLPGKSSK